MRRCDSCRKPIVPPEGPGDAELVLVGQNPGRIEYQLRRPMVGRSGFILRNLISQLGFQIPLDFQTPLKRFSAPSEVYITNASLCDCPPDRERLLREIHSLRHPVLIVALGRVSYQTLTEDSRGIREVSGLPVWKDDVSCWILPTIHPAAVLRGGVNAFMDFRYDLEKIPYLIRKGPPAKFPCDFQVVRDFAAFRRIYPRLLRSDRIAFDVETDDLYWYRGRVRLLSISWSPGEGAVLTEEALEDPQVLRRLEIVFRRPVWVGHNAKFDQTFLLGTLGIAPKLAEDTMLLEYCLDERPKGHLGLKYLGRREFFLEDWGKAVREASRGGPFTRAPQEILYPYAAQDAVVTLRLLEPLRERLEPELEKAYRFLLRANDLFVELDRRGVYYHLARAQDLAQRYASEIADIERRALREARRWGWDEEALNLRSPVQLRRLFYEVMGFRPPSRTEKGAPSTGEAALLALRKRHPEVPLWDMVLEHREKSKLLGTYLKPYLEEWSLPVPGRPELGIIYLDTSLTSTETGRLSTRKKRSAAVMTYPRSDELRSLFVAGPHHHAGWEDGDWFFFQFDYSQLELRVLAWMARCEYAIEQMKKGISFHRMAAEAIWGPHYTKEQYTRTKNFNFGVVYSGGNPLAGVSSDMNVEEAKRIARRYKEKMPELFEWFEVTARKVQDPGYAETPFGRRRRFPLILGAGHLRELQKECVNFMIQSTASDVTLSAMLRVWEELDSVVSLRWMMHDALIGYVARDNLHSLLDVWELIEDVGNALTGGEPPITAELGIGPSWGELEEFETKDALREMLNAE